MKTGMKNFLIWLMACLLPSTALFAKGETVLTHLQQIHSNASMLNIDKVVLSDTATEMYFTAKGKINSSFQFAPTTYLSDEKDRRYHLKAASGLKIGEYCQIPRSGQMEFRLIFAPMPKDTKIFDLIEGTDPGMYQILGIHSKKSKVKIPVTEDAVDADEISEAMFSDGKAFLSGQIKDYENDWKARILFFEYNRYGANLVQTYEESRICTIINPDGTFEAELPLDHPVWGKMILGNTPAAVPFYVRPGDTLRLMIKGWRKNALEVDYESSHPKGGLANLMKYQNVPVAYPTWDEVTRNGQDLEGEAFVEAIEKKLNENMRIRDYVIWKYGLSPFEAHLLKNRCRMQFANRSIFLADYWFQKKVVFPKGPEMKKEYYTGYDYSAYKFLSLIPWDDPSLSFLPINEFSPFNLLFYPLRNASSYAYYTCSPLTDNKGWIRKDLMEDSLQVETLRSLSGVKDTPWLMQSFLTKKFCIWKTDFTPAEHEMFVEGLSAYLTYPFFKRKIRELSIEMQRNTSPVFEMPEGKGRELMKKLVDKYKGRNVQVIFLSSYDDDLSFVVNNDVVNLLRSNVGNDNRDLQFLAIINKDSYPDEASVEHVIRDLNGTAIEVISGEEFVSLQKLFCFAYSPKQTTLDRNGLVFKQPLDMRYETMFRTQFSQLLKDESEIK